MARNDELHEQSDLVQQLAAFIRMRMNDTGVSIQDIADRTKHAYSYAYLRVNGKSQFTINDLDELAPALGYKDIFELWRKFDTQLRYEAAKARDPQPVEEPEPTPQRKPLPPAPQAEIDDLEARLARSQARIAQLKDYEIVADRSEREDEEFFD